jgi:hypothetical protein
VGLKIRTKSGSAPYATQGIHTIVGITRKKNNNRVRIHIDSASTYSLSGGRMIVYGKDIGELHYSVDKSPEKFALVQGGTLYVGAWAKCDQASLARLGARGEPTGTTFGSYHTGGDTWEWITAERAITASDDNAIPILQVNGSDVGDIAYFDAVWAGASAGGSGDAVAGQYRYVITYFNSGDNAESLPSDPSDVIEPSFEGVALSSIPASSDAQVTHNRIYRTKRDDVGENAVYYYVDQVAAATTTYTDTTGDSDLVTLLDENTGSPGSGWRYVIVHEGRLVLAHQAGSETQRLAYSEALDPNAFTNIAGTLSNYLDIDIKDNDEITGLARSQGRLLVFTNDDIFAVLDLGGNTERVLNIASGIGCLAPESIVYHHDQVYFVGRNGVYRIRGTQVEEVSVPIRGTIRGLDDSTLELAIAAVSDVDLRIFMNDQCYRMDLESGDWSIDDIDADAAWSVQDSSTSNKIVYFGLKEGFGCKIESNQSNYGVPSGTTSGTATAGTSTTLTDSGASFYTTGSGLIGVKILKVDSSSSEEVRTIASNTGTAITVSSAWSSTPVSGDAYYIGYIDFNWRSRAFGTGDTKTWWRHVSLVGEDPTSGTELTIEYEKDLDGTWNTTTATMAAVMPANYTKVRGRLYRFGVRHYEVDEGRTLKRAVIFYKPKGHF